jgi:integrase
MPRLLPDAVPAYRLHKQSGQAIVTLSGKDFLLGKYNTAASRAEYNRRIAEWIANRRNISCQTYGLTVSELIAAYKMHVEGCYRKPDGMPTSETSNIRTALKPLRVLYGATPAASISPLMLKAVRNEMVKVWCRTLINKQVNRIRQMFRWAVENEMVPASVYHGLLAVTPLKAGRCEARESEPVRPVNGAVIDATMPHLSSVIAAMVQFQRLTGCRLGEVCAMRIADVDRGGAIWSYIPSSHKTHHHGHRRIIFVGPKAQSVLQPCLMKLDPNAYIFNPAEAVAEMRQRRSDARKTPISCGNIRGTNVKRRPKRKPHSQYNVAAYRRAIARACDLAFPVPVDILGDKAKANAWRRAHRWHPHQLRHTAATDIRRQFGIEAAQHVLGHATLKVSELYAAKNAEVAKRVTAAMG